MMSKKAKATDPARFEGNGISFRAKIIGIVDVPDARGDKMCQETIQKLKNEVKVTGQHKQKIFINVTLEGLKIIDGVAMTVLHTHPVHQISFISRDVTDSRAFGYIFGPGENTHKFFGIKTANAAENLVLTLRDLFQTVYEMKKLEIEDAKAKAAGAEGENPDTNLQTPPEEGQAAEGQESIYQVPKNNAPVNPQEQEEAVANLLDLEDQVDHILKGIEQIRNLEFDDLPADEAPRQSVPSSAATAPTSTAPSSSIADLSDPWGAPSPASTAPPTSSLADLKNLVNSTPISNPFGMPAFVGSPVPNMGMHVPNPGMAAHGFGAMGPFGIPAPQPSGGLPVAMDPFGDNPFQPQLQRPQMSAPSPFAPQPGFGNPFPGGSVPGMPFPGMVGAPGMQPSFGMVGPARGSQPFGMVGAMGIPVSTHGGAGAGNMFPQQEENLLQPIRPGANQFEQQQQSGANPGKEALFGDLLDIKKSTKVDTSKTPKDLFKELNQPPKKSLNEIKKQETPTPASPKVNASPFGDAFLTPVNGKPN